MARERIETLDVVTRYVSEVDKQSVNKTKREAEGLNKIFATAAGTFAGFTAATLFQQGVQGLAAMGRQAVQLAADYETTSQSFAVLTGDIEIAKDLLAEIERFSIATPFEPKQIEQATKTLLGFGRETGVVLDDIELLGNVAAATGSDLQGLAVVFGQVAGAGRLMGQDALQFVNQGIPVYQLLGETLGVSTAELKKLQEQGKITFDDLRQAFEDAAGAGGKFDGALQKQSQTLNGLRSTLSGVIDLFLRNLGERFSGQLKAATTAAIGFFNSLVNITRIPLEEKLEREQTQLNLLAQAVGRAAEGTEERKNAIDELQRIYPDFLKGLDAEKLTNEELRDRLNEVNNGYILKIALAKEESRLNELATEYAQAAANQREQENALQEKINEKLQTNRDLRRAAGLEEELFGKSLEEQLDIIERFLLAERQARRDRAQGSAPIQDITALEEIRDLRETDLELLKQSTIEAKRLYDEGIKERDAAKKDLEQILGIETKITKTKTESTSTTKTKSAEQLRKEALEKELESTLIAIEDNNQERLRLLEELGQDEIEQREFINNAFLIRELQLQQEVAQIRANDAFKFGESLGVEQYTSEWFELQDQINGTKSELSQFLATAAIVRSLPFRIDPDFELVNPDNKIDSFLKQIFGNDADIEGIKAAYSDLAFEVVRLFDGILQNQINLADEEVNIQQDRVNEILRIRGEGSQRQLQIEQERLDKIQAQREEFVRKQQALARLETIANLTVAIAKIIATETIGAAVAVPAILALFAGAIGSLPGVVGFAEGTEYVKGKGTHKSDSVPAWLSVGERVLSWDQNKDILKMSNDQLVTYAKIGEQAAAGKLAPNVMQIFTDSSNQSRAFKELSSKLDAVVFELQNIKVNAEANIDHSGLSSAVRIANREHQRTQSRLR